MALKNKSYSTVKQTVGQRPKARMKPFYPIHGVLAYYSPQKAEEMAINWTLQPHEDFANLNLNWEESWLVLEPLVGFDRKYGVLLAEHWQMTPEIRDIFLKAPNLTEQEREKLASQQKWEIAVTETDVETARSMQTLLREAWKGDALAVEEIQFGISHHPSQEAFGPPRLTVAPSAKGLVLYAKDLWSFIRVAFLLHFERGLTKFCGNPECRTPYFIATRKDQKYCEHGACTTYAQRKYALGWWERKGYELRAKKSKRNKRRK